MIALPDVAGAPLESAVLRPVRAHHAFEGCVEQLATAIRLGVYPRGSMLPPERELAERLGVSRASLREAMAALRKAGLVETRRGRAGGTVVLHRPRLPARGNGGRRLRGQPADQRADWLDALDFRRVVEPGAAALAAGLDVGEAGRRRLVEAHEAVVAAQTRAEHRQADSRFHLTLATLGGSTRIAAAVTSVQASLHEMLSAIPVLETNIEHSHRQHAALTQAVLTGRPERARAVMEEHCDDTAALLRGLLD